MSEESWPKGPMSEKFESSAVKMTKEELQLRLKEMTKDNNNAPEPDKDTLLSEVSCKWCGATTLNTMIKTCDSCIQLYTGIDTAPNISEAMLSHIKLQHAKHGLEVLAVNDPLEYSMIARRIKEALSDKT